MMDDLISRQAALAAIDQNRQALLSLGMTGAEDILAHHGRRVIEELPTIDPVEHGGWVPCSERLPEEKKAVYWVCDDNGSQFECRWTNANPVWTGLTTYWHWNIFDVPQYSKVVAWMPLPEPYKEKEDET